MTSKGRSDYSDSYVGWLPGGLCLGTYNRRRTELWADGKMTTPAALSLTARLTETTKSILANHEIGMKVLISTSDALCYFATDSLVRIR